MCPDLVSSKHPSQPDELNWLFRSGRHFRSAPLTLVSFPLRGYESFRHPGTIQPRPRNGAAPAIHAVTAESDSMAAFPAASFIAEPLTAATPTWKTFVADTIATFKLRVTTLVVMTAWAGYYLGASPIRHQFLQSHLLDTLIGVALVSCGASALNQAEERRTDALMIRTRNRPLASRQAEPGVRRPDRDARDHRRVHCGWSLAPISSPARSPCSLPSPMSAFTRRSSALLPWPHLSARFPVPCHR